MVWHHHRGPYWTEDYRKTNELYMQAVTTEAEKGHSILPFYHSAILPFCHSAILPFCRSAILNE